MVLYLLSFLHTNFCCTNIKPFIYLKSISTYYFYFICFKPCIICNTAFDGAGDGDLHGRELSAAQLMRSAQPRALLYDVLLVRGQQVHAALLHLRAVSGQTYFFTILFTKTHSFLNTQRMKGS